MSDDRRKKKLDRRRINLGQLHEVRWWTKALGVSRSRLHELVELVGTSANRVRLYLKHINAARELVASPVAKRAGKRKKAAKK